MIKRAKLADDFLQGSEQGYITYKKYLVINMHFTKGINPFNCGKIRETRCSRDKYAAHKLQGVFEKISKSMNPRDAEKLLVYYQLENQFPSNDIYINEYNVEDLIEYDNVLRKLSYTVKSELKMLWDMASCENIFKGSPSKLTKLLHSRRIRPETYIYLSLAIDIPFSDDMVTTALLSMIDKYKPWFYYFTEMDEKKHKARAMKMLNDIN